MSGFAWLDEKSRRYFITNEDFGHSGIISTYFLLFPAVNTQLEYYYGKTDR